MKILIVEDDLVSRRVHEGMLWKWGYDVLVAQDGHDGLKKIQGEDPPRLMILVWMTPGMVRIQVAREVRKGTAEPYIYILLLTAKGRKEDIVEGREAGRNRVELAVDAELRVDGFERTAGPSPFKAEAQ